MTAACESLLAQSPKRQLISRAPAAIQQVGMIPCERDQLADAIPPACRRRRAHSYLCRLPLDFGIRSLLQHVLHDLRDENSRVEDEAMPVQVSEWLQDDPRIELSLLMRPALISTSSGGREWSHQYFLRCRDDSVSSQRYTELPVSATAIEHALLSGGRPIVAALTAMNARAESEFFGLCPIFRAAYDAMAISLEIPRVDGGPAALTKRL
jgi:hypothetical protein